MTQLQDRIVAAETRFNELLKQRDDINEELNRLQGEYRVLVELRDSEKQPNTEATVIEAVAEEEK
ncbi:hypothetical protein UFOVP253_51 [uncultured Caudovirales phage]|uniref:Uncharacterized protein n=1 Tax=uncultured Caudovirales phage TaxID=2100421 RepID=A0A6J5LHD5_9CAUD|nr:hypothetical protein UFOVP253_51 [uncultured Caudovirales phage]